MCNGSRSQRVKRCKRNCCCARMFFITELSNMAINDFDAEKSACFSWRFVVTELVINDLLYAISPLTTELELAEMSSTDSEGDETENEDESSRGIYITSYPYTPPPPPPPPTVISMVEPYLAPPPA